MSKKIIHFQMPLREDGQPVMAMVEATNYINYLKKVLPKYYLVLCSPFKVNVDGDTVKFDIKGLEDKMPPKLITVIKGMVEKEGFIVEIIK